MEVKLNGDVFWVNPDEFKVQPDQEYSTLQLRPDLGVLEREIGLILELLELYQIDTFTNLGVSHGGYLPIKIASKCQNVNIVTDESVNAVTDESVNAVTDESVHVNNLKKNLKNHQLINKIKLVSHLSETKGQQIIKIENELLQFNYKESDRFIILHYGPLELKQHVCYKLSDSKLFLYVPQYFNDQFIYHFKWLIGIESIGSASINFNYNNLINLCMIVKNAGDGFRKVLTENLEFIDYYTILDTGSTDQTVEVIKDVLKDKPGKLYQEPFINFRESRNRCLELAGTKCKYTIMLDDTYILKGNVRKFLEHIRSDQFADSYNIFINSDNNIYGSNRILKSEKQLRYVYLIHEIIQEENNIVVQLPLDQISIEDVNSDYMIERTKARKESDLIALHQTLIEYPKSPRTYYYLARTYMELKNWEKTFEAAMNRINHPNKGYAEETTECYLICADVAHLQFKWEWSKCEELYLGSYLHDKSCADGLYCIGMHYQKENQLEKAFQFYKQAFEIGISKTKTSNLRANIYNKLLPYHLTGICYSLNKYDLGLRVSTAYLEHNAFDLTIESYRQIFYFLDQGSKLSSNQIVTSGSSHKKKILCFVAYNSFKEWNGDSIKNEGLGGSETYVIEMAKRIIKLTDFDVQVFCNVPPDQKEERLIEGVTYRSLTTYLQFMKDHLIDTVIISRNSEYIPVTLNNQVENVYLVLHDLTPSGNIIPTNPKLRAIFCLTEWHAKYFLSAYPMFADRVKVLPNGINLKEFANLHVDHEFANLHVHHEDPGRFSIENLPKLKNSFIYSSTANRGLIHVLRAFPRIRELVPDATLNIFADTKLKWARKLNNSEMDEIERLIDQQKEYVTNHGWVKKSELYRYFLRSEYWLYPCTFQETFCVTALEAAAAGVIPVTNDLAALKETVADRGILISGDPVTNEWQSAAIQAIVDLSKNSEKRRQLTDLNYRWAQDYDWDKVAANFIKISNINTNTTPNTISNTNTNTISNITSNSNTNSKLVKYYAPIEENVKYLTNRFRHCKKVLEIGPGSVPFPLATHFVDHIKNDKLDACLVMDITKERLPFKNNEFDLVYCRHVLEDIHNPEFVMEELTRVARIVYIETPSPIVETTRQVDAGRAEYRGYIHHRYLIYADNDTLTFLPKFPIIEYLELSDQSEKLKDPYMWNTYFIYDNTQGPLKMKMLIHGNDYYLQRNYKEMIDISIEKSTESITRYINEMKSSNSNEHRELIEIERILVKSTDSSDYDLLINATKMIKGISGLTVEIGVREGGSSYLIMKTLLENNDRRVAHLGVDPYGNIEYVHWETRIERLDYTNMMKNKAMRNLSEWCKLINYNFILMPLEDTEFFKRFEDGVPIYNDRKQIFNQYALVFFDGPHSTKAIEIEMNFFRNKTPIGGVWIFDDVGQYPHLEVIEPQILKMGFKILNKGRNKISYQRIKL